MSILEGIIAFVFGVVLLLITCPRSPKRSFLMGWWYRDE